MKNLFCLLGVFCTLFMFSQNNKLQKEKPQFTITYEVLYRPQENVKTYKKEYMILQTDGEKSVFYNGDLKKVDSLVGANSPLLTKDFVLPYLNFKVYKDLANNTTMITGDFNQFRYVVKDDETLSWKPINLPEVKIGNYKIRQSIADYGGRKWIASYATELPIFDGPYVLKGLPGLIVTVISEEGDYLFKMISIVKNPKPKAIEIPKPNIKKQDIENKTQDFVKNPTHQNISYTNVWGDVMYYDQSKSTPEQKKESDAKITSILEKFNNPPNKNLPIINLY